MSELNEMSCEEFADIAAELALGVLTGRERAQALAHLDRCDACRDNVRALAQTGEELLGLLPAIEPPPGFETRVLERIGMPVPSPAPSPVPSAVPSQAPRRGPVRVTRRLLTTAAVVAAIAAAALGGWGLRAATTPQASSPLSAAALVSPSPSRQTTGKIFVYNGSPRWLYMSVDMNSGNGTVICQLVSKDGRVTTVGSFRLTGGYGSWGSPEPAGVGPLAGARLVTPDGTVLATASFA